MIIDVIPAKKMPRQLSLLSYRVGADLAHKIKVGQVVRIPLRNNLIMGTVAAIDKKIKINPRFLKNIVEIITPQAVFSENQIKLFLELALYYSISATLFVHHNMPKSLKGLKYTEIKPSRKKKKEVEYLWWKNIEEKNLHYKKSLRGKGQILIIVPRIFQIEEMAKSLNIRKYNAIHGQLKRKDSFKIWQECLGGKDNIYIGTRSAIFYPFTNLKNIIIDEEESDDHKQCDMNPRYDVRVVAKKIIEISGGKLIFSSNSPSVESYYTSKKQLPKKLSKEIISQDLNNEFTKENYSFIGEKLEEEIQNTLENKKQVFLFINKKGESSSTVCKDCNYVFLCRDCNLPLIRDRDNKLVCYYCGNKEEVPPFCPKCQKPNIHSKGLGIQKIEQNLLKILPKIKIAILDKTVESNSQYIEADVIIGTEFALDKIPWGEIGLVGIINADQLWGHAEFSTSLKAFSLMSKILTLAPKNAKIIIQTFSIENYIVKSIIENNPNIFYKEELDFRKNFSYPPFVDLIKLSVLEKSEKKAESEAQKIYQKINKASNPKIEISFPLPITRRKIRGKFKYNIVLKLKDLKDFNSLIKSIPSNCLIDISPKTLLD